MSRAFIAGVIKETTQVSNAAARESASLLLGAITQHLRKHGKFSLPGFGTFTVKHTNARRGLNPRTGDPVDIAAGKTVRFKASKTLKNTV
jgi:DNA-binding protein HU-beta